MIQLSSCFMAAKEPRWRLQRSIVRVSHCRACTAVLPQDHPCSLSVGNPRQRLSLPVCIKTQGGQVLHPKGNGEGSFALISVARFVWELTVDCARVSSTKNDSCTHVHMLARTLPVISYSSSRHKIFVEAIV